LGCRETPYYKKREPEKKWYPSTQREFKLFSQKTPQHGLKNEFRLPGQELTLDYGISSWMEIRETKPQRFQNHRDRDSGKVTEYSDPLKKDGNGITSGGTGT